MHNKAKYEEKLLDLPQQKIRDARQMTYEKLMQSLEDRPLITRDFDDSTKLGKFLQNLDDEKRTLFELQLNSTKLRFVEASKHNARNLEKTERTAMVMLEPHILIIFL